MSTCAALTLAVMVPPSTIGASVSTLKHRQHRQTHLLHRYQGTVRFFHRHPRQARTVVGRRETRRARVWVRVLRHELAETRAALKPPRPRSVPQIICAVFGPECGKALSVAACESRYSTGATNGQYRGVFQMGENERRIYGGSSLDPWDQIRAAYRYWQVAGWSPWSCA